MVTFIIFESCAALAQEESAGVVPDAVAEAGSPNCKYTDDSCLRHLNNGQRSPSEDSARDRAHGLIGGRGQNVDPRGTGVTNETGI